MSKEILAVDIDDTLFPFATEFLRYYNHLSDTTYRAEDLTAYDWQDFLGLPAEELANHIYAFHRIDDLHIKPVERSQDVIGRLREDFDFIGVTARHQEFEPSSLRYLQHTFDGAFKSVVAIGHNSVRTKASVCREMGAVGLVDDGLRHLRNCVADKLKGVLFGEYSWNKDSVVDEGIVQCKDWLEVEAYITGSKRDD